VHYCQHPPDDDAIIRVLSFQSGQLISGPRCKTGAL